MTRLTEQDAIVQAVADYNAGVTQSNNSLAGAGQIQRLVYQYMAAGVTTNPNRQTPIGRIMGYIFDYGFTPLSLFSAGEQGIWLDPSDFSTMFQDSAGTTPVTAVEQPVGLILDKSGRGNHASQATATSRPVVSARYNLLTKTEQFSDAVWAKTNLSSTDSAGTSSNGQTVSRLSSTAINSFHSIQSAGVSSPTGTKLYGRIGIKADGCSWARLGIVDAGGSGYVFINLVTGAIGTYVTSGNAITNVIVTAAGTSEWIIEFCRVTQGNLAYYDIGLSKADNDSCFFNGVITDSILVWGTSLVPSGLSSLPYQRVNTATDYTTTGFYQYDKYDGVDDYLTTAAGGQSTTAFFYCAAIKLDKIGAAQTLLSDTGANTGYRVRINASNQLEFSAGNNVAYTTANTTATLAIGEIAVLTCWHDGVNLNAQINNGTVAQAAFATATAGTAAVTIGRDNGAATSYFRGGIYADIYVKDDACTVAERTSAKAYCASKAGITL